MSDREGLNGQWAQTYLNEDCAEHPIAVGLVTEFDNGNFSVRLSSGELLLKGLYTLNQNDALPHIDWTDTIGPDLGKTFLSIYTLTANTFTFCAADQGMPGPTSFSPKNGHTIRKFERLKHA